MKDDNKSKINMNNIICPICNDIKKIRINSNWIDKTMSITFECNHKRNIQEKLEQNDYCKNCGKYVKQDTACKESNHDIIKAEDLYFFCRIHMKKLNAYCEDCKLNFCDECTCNHDKIKSKYEYYFSYNQIQELSSVSEEVQNFINMTFSIDCNKQIIGELLNYYEIYTYLYNKRFFHINIIYNINLFYNYFIFLLNSKLKFTGSISISEINNIKDSTIFYDSDFKDQFRDLIDMKSFNFNNILILFLLSKRFEIKRELFEKFENHIHSLISNNILAYDNIEKNIIEFKDNFNDFKEILNSNRYEIIKIQNEINFDIFSIKITKITIPLNLKGKLINFLQKEILKKYKTYLHKIKPNITILNNIKKKYKLFQKQNKKLYDTLGLEEKIKEINNLKPEGDDSLKQSIYFEGEFSEKNLLNAFIFFTQKLRYPKNDVNTEFRNSKENKDLVNKNMDNLNINDKESDKNSIINQESMKEYIKFLNDIKYDIENSYKDIAIKKKINLGNIVDALLKNNFSNIFEISQNETENKNGINALINECFNELNTIQYNEEVNKNSLDYLYSGIISSKFQVEVQKIFSSLINNRKYKSLLENIKDNSAQIWNNENNILLYQDLEQMLIKSGGFDEMNANCIVKIIGKYMHYSNEIKELKERWEKYRIYAKENFELELKIKQLKKIKYFIQKYNEELKYYNKNYELNEMTNIITNFESNVDKLIENSLDNNLKKILKDIQTFVHGKNISEIIELLKDIFKDNESNSYIDEILDLESYAWCIQNGHDDIVEF